MMNQGLLERLSTELIQAILSELSDIQSLESAVLTGPCLYAAFKGADSQIVESVLSQQFDADLLHDALAVEVSMQKSTWQESDVNDFLDSYLCRNKQPFHYVLDYTLSQAFRLARLLAIIDRFTRDLTARYLLEISRLRTGTQSLHILPSRYPKRKEIALSAPFTSSKSTAVYSETRSNARIKAGPRGALSTMHFSLHGKTNSWRAFMTIYSELWPQVSHALFQDSLAPPSKT
jgi:hypothetical protein